MKADYHSDEYLEAMLSQFKIIEPKLQCDNGKPISRMCINPECSKPSLMCQDDECEKCGDFNHPQCSTFKFKAFTKLLCDRNQQQKGFILEVCKIESALIDQLHKSRFDFTRKAYLGDLSEKHLCIVQAVYKNNDTKSLSGKEAESLVRKLRCKQGNGRQKVERVLQNFKEYMDHYFNQIIELKKRLYESLNSGPELCEIDSNILKNPLSVNLSEFQKGQQVMSATALQHTKFLMAALKNPKRLQLLYRGSQNQFKATVFHKKCDNIPNTLTILRTQFGKTIAGFTKYPWNAVNNNFVNDAGKHTFLLSLDLKQKMVPISEHKLIYCNNFYGPHFGNGADLHISDQCHTNKNSNANFPYAYNVEGGSKYINSQDSYRAFSGATNGFDFRVVEYEVFRVVYQ